MLLLTTQRQKQHISQTDKTEIHYKILASVFNNSYEVAAVFKQSFSIFGEIILQQNLLSLTSIQETLLVQPQSSVEFRQI